MIYLDYNATTPIDPRVADAMIPYLREHHGNASSNHPLGRKMRQAVDTARSQVAAMINAEPDEIVFTSGGSEANNHVIKGIAQARKDRGKHLIISCIEHPAVTRPAEHLVKDGFTIGVAGCDLHGRVGVESVTDEVMPSTILVSIMHANNEVGTVQPIADIAEAAREGGILMHTDAAQSCGKVPVDVKALGVDFLSIAGHKFYAPPGIGALYIRRGVELESLIHGAGHESGRRAGTEAVPSIVGLGVAAELARESLGDGHLAALRDRLYDGLVTALGDRVVLNGHPEHRLPNTLNVGFSGHRAADIVARCPDLACSIGAACHSGRDHRSAVLAAMDVPDEIALGSLRLSTGRFTTEEEVDRAVEMLVAAVG